MMKLAAAATVLATASAGASKLVNPCLDETQPFAKQPWCNASLSVEARIADMLGRMTLAEKIASLGTSQNAVPSLGLPAYNWRTEGEHGVRYATWDAETPYATSFAFPSCLAMSFNRSRRA